MYEVKPSKVRSSTMMRPSLNRIVGDPHMRSTKIGMAEVIALHHATLILQRVEIDRPVTMGYHLGMRGTALVMGCRQKMLGKWRVRTMGHTRSQQSPIYRLESPLAACDIAISPMHRSHPKARISGN
jgi:hypothetical protein